MKYILLIFALLIAGCDVKEPIPCKSVAKQFSDANPVQFWPIDCLTYNENEVCGIHPKCWCHPWECDDEIPIQFTDTEDLDYLLGIYDSGDSLISTIPITQEVNGVFLQGLSDGVDDDFNADSSTHQPWTVGSVPHISISSPSGQSAFFLLKIYGAKALTNYNFDYSILRGISGTGTVSLYLVTQAFYDAGGVGSPLASHALSMTNGTFVENGTFSYIGGASTPAYLMVFVYNISGTTSAQINTITLQEQVSISLVFVYSALFIPSQTSPDFCNQKIQLKIILDTSPEEIIAKSECLDIADNHDCTTIIDYSNNRNFAGLIYTGLASVPTFKIRIPAIFFHEQFPEEDEAMELTTGIQKTSGTLKVQRLFDTDYMPYYMHKKLQLIFKHQFITINGLSWLKEEKYEIQPGERRWPIKKAKCFLTQDYIQRAVL